MVAPLWKIDELREHVAVVDGKVAPTLVLANARYLHSIFKTWMTANIWIYKDRIIYVGEKMPSADASIEVMDCTGKTIVPGYIEPHVHPFQLYGPDNFANFAAQSGTTTFISDNLNFFLALKNEQAFAVIDRLNTLPYSFYWWARFDSQTELPNEEELFTSTRIIEWLSRDDVLLGGELTGWTRLIRGDDHMLSRLQLAKRLHKKVEAHLPGSSPRTLARLKLMGADGDHEAMTAEEVENRLHQGYGVTLRYSSIRPDLPLLLRGVLEKELNVFDHLMMTTDGCTPLFYEDGIMDKCIRLALQEGVAPIDAYQMASYNIARYYDMTNLHGVIATGRFATLNILRDEFSPTPESVLAKGTWVKRNSESCYDTLIEYPEFSDYSIDFDLTLDDFQFSTPVGITMINDVITKPYTVTLPTDGDLATTHDESYLVLIDKNGTWRVNTLLKGFATAVKGFASTYSNTGDIIIIGKIIRDMMHAFAEVKRMNGGIALVEDNKVIAKLPLQVAGAFSNEQLDVVIEQERELRQALTERGYEKGDAIYTLLFLMSIHLPYIRITPKGIYDVMKDKVLLPAVMR